MKIFFILFFVHCFIFPAVVSANSLDSNKNAELASVASVKFQELETGLNYFLIEDKKTQENSSIAKQYKIHFLQIDPKYFEISLYGAFLEEDKKNHTLEDWTMRHKLLASINASMYWPDNLTSTGYMKKGSAINNGRIMERMGALFLSKPYNSTLASMQIVETTAHDFESILPNYAIAVQNFRILGNFNPQTNQAEILWEQSLKKSSISALAEDIKGNFYFIYSEIPLSVYDFAHYLINIPLEIKNQNELISEIFFQSLLYLEGGSDAGLYINTSSSQKQIITSEHSSFFYSKPLLPNILGIRHKGD